MATQTCMLVYVSARLTTPKFLLWNSNTSCVNDLVNISTNWSLYLQGFKWTSPLLTSSLIKWYLVSSFSYHCLIHRPIDFWENLDPLKCWKIHAALQILESLLVCLCLVSSPVSLTSPFLLHHLVPSMALVHQSFCLQFHSMTLVPWTQHLF